MTKFSESPILVKMAFFKTVLTEKCYRCGFNDDLTLLQFLNKLQGKYLESVRIKIAERHSKNKQGP